jgi:uncharacterized protein (TIGR02145 family)
MREWTVLSDYLGGESVAGGKMKSTGMQYWQASNTGATNESGFSGLPGGLRVGFDGHFSSVNYSGFWMSASESDAEGAWYRRLDGSNAGIDRFSYSKIAGFTVRCLMD